MQTNLMYFRFSVSYPVSPPSCAPPPQLFSLLAQALGSPLEFSRTGSCALFSLAHDGVPLLLHVDASSPKFPDQLPTLTITNVRYAECCTVYFPTSASSLIVTLCR